jgi:hypothetical protein
VAPPIEISEIQGAAHLSPRNGDTVPTTGVLIGKIGSSFYIQDPTPDANSETSDGLQVFGASAAAGVSVGDEVSVRGMVSDFRSGLTSLTLTELTSPVVTVLSSGNPLPAPTVIGTGGRIPPSTVIEDDATGNVEAPGVLFDPAEDGLDFYESLEGMLYLTDSSIASHLCASARACCRASARYTEAIPPHAPAPDTTPGHRVHACAPFDCPASSWALRCSRSRIIQHGLDGLASWPPGTLAVL